MEEEDEELFTLPDNNDPMIPAGKEFVRCFMSYESAMNSLMPMIFDRYGTDIWAYDRSERLVKGFLEACLPDDLRKPMELFRQFHRIKMSQVPSQFQIKLTSARSRKRQINNLINKLFIAIRKNYGEDLPPFAVKTPSAKAGRQSDASSEQKKTPEVKNLFDADDEGSQAKEVCSVSGLPRRQH
jgi:hypothetical protein